PCTRYWPRKPSRRGVSPCKMAGKPPGNGLVSTGQPARAVDIGSQHGGSHQGGRTMGAIRVHEFISLDSVIDTPSWTFPFGFDPRMGEAIGRITTSSDGILLGRTTYEMFEPAWSRRTAEEDPGAPFFNDTSKYVVSSTLTTATWRNTEIIGGYDPKRIQQLKGSAQGLY